MIEKITPWATYIKLIALTEEFYAKR